MVNWEAVGAIAVVISLVYLASQIKQANLQAQGAAHSDWFVGWNDSIKGWIADRDTIHALQRGFDDFNALSKVDQAVFAQQLAAVINQWHLAVDFSERGLRQESVRNGIRCEDLLDTGRFCLSGELLQWVPPRSGMARHGPVTRGQPSAVHGAGVLVVIR